MSELDSRISPRKCPSSEPRHVYNNKIWVRPGYNPSSPVKKHTAHHLGPSPSRSDGEPALLSRMDLTDFTYSTSKRTNPRNRRRHRSGRSLGNLEDSGGLILGNHRITYSVASDTAISRSPSPVSGVTEHGGTLSPHACREAEDPDFIPGLHLRVVDDATTPESSSCRKPHGSPLDLVTGSKSRPSETEKLQDHGDLASSWSRPSLKERIAPLIKQNAYLRYMHDRHREPNNRIAPLVDDKSMDAIMTSPFIDSITNSLITCQSQLAQKRANNAPAIKNSLDTEVHVENLPPPVTSKAPLVPSSSIDLSLVSGSLSDKTPIRTTVTENQFPKEPSIDTTIATDHSTTPIQAPIPIPSPIISPQSSVFNSFVSPSDMTREKYGSSPQRKRSRSPGSYTRPYKRPRSRSPPPFRRSQDTGWSPRDRTPRSPPPSYRRLPPSPHMSRRPSSSYTSHHSGSPCSSKSPHTSPYISHPSRSPYKSRRSRSPHSQRSKSPPLYTQESPRRLEVDTAEYPRGRPPPASEEYFGGSSKQRYLTAFEREKLEKTKRVGGQGHAGSNVLDSPQVVKRGQAGSGSSTNRTSVEKHTNLSPVPPHVMTSARHRSPRAPALPSAEGDLFEVGGRDQEQYPSTNDAKDGAVNNAKSDSQTRDLAGVEKAGAILKPDTQPKGVLPPWKPFGSVPGIWLLMNGSAKPDVYEHSFEISKKVAFEWNLPRVSVNGESTTGTKFGDAQPPPGLSWKLKCVQAVSVDLVRQRLECHTTAENLIQELSRFQNHWPSGGKLIVEVNPTHLYGQTLYSKQLDSNTPFVELKHHICEGTNLIRFIQLGDLSKFVFILYATDRTTSPQTDPHTLDLDNLQIMLQKSRLYNLPGSSNHPAFGAHTAHVSFTVNHSS